MAKFGSFIENTPMNHVDYVESSIRKSENMLDNIELGMNQLGKMLGINVSSISTIKTPQLPNFMKKATFSDHLAFSRMTSLERYAESENSE